MENVICLHKASDNGCLEDISAKAISNVRCVEELLVKKLQKDNLYLQSTISTQQGEIVVFARELQKEQSRSNAHKRIYDVTSLVSSHVSRQKEMVGARLSGIRETAGGS